MWESNRVIQYLEYATGWEMAAFSSETRACRRVLVQPAVVRDPARRKRVSGDDETISSSVARVPGYRMPKVPLPCLAFHDFSV